jgi:NTE family protein
MGRERALVLGGGGPVGIAWEAGVLVGLAEAGVDPSGADAIVGTSAGSVVGALLGLGRTPAEIAEEWGRPLPASPRRSDGAARAPAPDLAVLIGKIQEAIKRIRPGPELAAELGAFALAASTIDEAAFFDEFGPLARAARGAAWPARFSCTAFEAASGHFTVWDAQAGADLVRAVASSCAVPGFYPPISVGGRRYIDGGLLSPTNAQLAQGHERVLVLSVTEAFLAPLARARQRPTALEREVSGLRQGGARVDVIQMDAEAGSALGPHLLSPRHRHLGLEAGLRQDRAEAARVGALWRDAQRPARR